MFYWGNVEPFDHKAMLKLFFLLFVLLFLGINEWDVISYLQSYAMGHFVTPRPWLSAIVLTMLVWTVVHYGGNIMQKHKKDNFPLYAFCTWAITALTSLSFVSLAYQAILLIVGIMLVYPVVRLKKKIQSSTATTPWKNTQSFFLQMFVLCLYMGIGNGVTDVEHYELRTAQDLMTNHPKKGYKIGEKSYATSQRLFAMRCYLLAKTEEDEGGLGENIFDQVVPKSGAASLFFPKDNKQQLLLPTDSLEHLLGGKRHTNEQPIAYLRRCARQASLKSTNHIAIDYYLCGLLLERDLNTFAREVKRFYPHEISTGKLPTYFAQALLLYKRSTTQPQVFYTDSSIEANLQDYMDMGDTISNRNVRSNLLRRSYGTTYWWWYTYGTRS